MNREQYLLLLLMEECSEVQKIASKCVRFGKMDKPPDGNLPENRKLLQEEFGDVWTITQMLAEEFNYDFTVYSDAVHVKKKKINKYGNLSKKLGFIKDD
jgi:NTP pyrophosphatase (non-canonical NTP hydrolase)